MPPLRPNKQGGTASINERIRPDLKLKHYRRMAWRGRAGTACQMQTIINHGERVGRPVRPGGAQLKLNGTQHRAASRGPRRGQTSSCSTEQRIISLPSDDGLFRFPLIACMATALLQPPTPPLTTPPSPHHQALLPLFLVLGHPNFHLPTPLHRRTALQCHSFPLSSPPVLSILSPSRSHPIPISLSADTGFGAGSELLCDGAITALAGDVLLTFAAGRRRKMKTLENYWLFLCRLLENLEIHGGGWRRGRTLGGALSPCQGPNSPRREWYNNKSLHNRRS